MAVRHSITKATPFIFLRKKRKWPRSPFKTKWHYIFNQQQALQSLQKSAQLLSSQQIPSIVQPDSLLLTSLINSFNSYNCKPTPNAYYFIIKTMIQKSHFNELNIVLSHLKLVETFDTPEFIFVDLIRVYGENGMVKEAIELFCEMPHYRCVPTASSLNSLLLVLCKSSDCFSIVPQMLLKSRVMNVRIEESTFYILVSALCRIGKVAFAIKLLDYMIGHEFCPGNKLCSLILSSLCKQKDGSSSGYDLMAVFEDLKGVGFCPGIDDFRNVVKFLTENGRGEDAFGVLCEMKRVRIKPDIMCYTMVMYSLVEQGEFLRAEELFDEVLLFGFVPLVRTYNVYISGLCKQKKVEDGYMMVKSMEDLGCAANQATYSIVLEGFCKAGSLNRARDVWMEMKSKGFGSSAQAYRIMVDGLVNGGEIVEACTWLEEMLSLGFTPLPSTVEEMIYHLCHEGLLVIALDIIGQIVNHNVIPASKAWEAVLQGLNLDLHYVNTELPMFNDHEL